MNEPKLTKEQLDKIRELDKNCMKMSFQEYIKQYDEILEENFEQYKKYIRQEYFMNFSLFIIVILLLGFVIIYYIVR